MRNSKAVKIKDVVIGAGNAIAVQSMCNTKTLDTQATIAQINALKLAGCDIVRLAVTNMQEVAALHNYVHIMPVVADIQFDYKLAVACADAGVAKIRFNPGNIGSIARVKEVVSACKQNCVPIRIGVNGGSLEQDLLKKYGKGVEAMVQSAMSHVRVLEDCSFYDIVISIKSSSVKQTIEANRQIAKLCDYPLHLGVTEAGTYNSALTKSAVAIGGLLLDGIGDTIRVSVTGDPLQEIEAAKSILSCIGMKSGVEIISCPTCSRCDYALPEVAHELERFCKDINVPLKIAVMGCVVNGPGEARDCDLGVAGGKNKSVLFEKGAVIGTVDNHEIVQKMQELILKIIEQK